MNPQAIYRQMTSEKGLVLADQVLVSGSAFVTNLLLAQALGPAAYGRFSAIVLVQLFLLSIQQAAGSGIYAVVWPGLPTETQKRYTDGVLFGMLGWLAGLALLAGGVFTLFPAVFAGYDSELLTASAMACGLYLLQDFLRKVLLVQQRSGRALLLDGLTNAAQLGLLAVFRSQHRLSLPAAVWIVGLTFLPSVALGLVWLKPKFSQFPAIRLVWQQHRYQGGWMLLSALMQWLAGNFFVVAGGWTLGATALGALRLAQYIFGLLNVLLQALENYVVPRAAQRADSPGLQIAYLRTVWVKSLLALLPLLLLLTLGAQPLLTWVGGADYGLYAYVMYGLTAVYALVVCSYPLRILLRVRHLGKHYFFGYALATAASLATVSWLVGQYGLTGVLSGLFLTQAILIFYWLLILQHNGLLRWKSFTLFSAKPIRPE